MSEATHTVLEDNSRLSKVDSHFSKLESKLALIGGVVIFTLVILSVINILGRWLFNLPVNGYIDWVEQSIAFFAFLGIAFTQRLGAHIRMDILLSRLKGRALWLLELITVVLVLPLIIFLIYGSYLHFFRAYSIGDTSFDIDLPTWPAKLVVPIALSFLVIRIIIQILGYIRAIKKDTDKPIAVPLIEDASTVATKEAENIFHEKLK